MVSNILRRSGIAIGRTSVLLKWKPELVIQVGVGRTHDETRVMQEIWPGVEFIGFEPHPGLYEDAKKTYPGILIQSAVGDFEGKADLFYKFRHKDGATLKRPIEERDRHRIVKVDVGALDQLMETFTGGVKSKKTLLWLDCEGSELDVLHGAEETLRSCEAVNVELTSRIKGEGWCKPVEIHRFLKMKGFRRQVAHSHRGAYGQCDVVYMRRHLWKEDYCHCITELEEEWDRKEKE